MLRHSQSGFTQFEQVPAPMAENKHEKVALRQMGRAIAQDRLRLVYQPVVKAANPEFPAFFECLLRIEEPSGHLASAGPFMPLIEHHEMGRMVDRMVLRRALAALREHPNCRLSVNVSAQTLGDAEWLSILFETAELGDHIADRLIIEITESSHLDTNETNANFFDRVRAAGCSVAIDDFGAGHTALSHLRDFRFDMLKIDGSFVRGLRKHSANQFLVQKMIEIAKHFDLLIIAEWVETEEEASLLTEMGVDCIQGFLYGQPMTGLPALNAIPTQGRVSL